MNESRKYDLFGESVPESETPAKHQPLAERFRPRNLDEFIGQEHIVGENGFLREIISKDAITSLIFWGPPGSGKTTLAKIISLSTNAEFVSFSAVASGVKDIREVIAQARIRQGKTILFIDEIHRFNKAQQDAFLPHVEDGTIVLIGATTENPSFEVNSPLLSRSRVLVLDPLSTDNIRTIVLNAVEDKERGVANTVSTIEEDALEAIVSFSGGDARRALNVLELSASVAKKHTDSGLVITVTDVEKASQKKRSAMTVQVKNISISFRRFTRVCGDLIPMRRSTGSAVCLKAVRIRFISQGVWCVLPRKISEMQIRRLCKSP